jgi:hypothetical protein
MPARRRSRFTVVPPEGPFSAPGLPHAIDVSCCIHAGMGGYLRSPGWEPEASR